MKITPRIDQLSAGPDERQNSSGFQRLYGRIASAKHGISSFQSGRRFITALSLAGVLCGHSVIGQEPGVLGYWKEPKGSVIWVESCGKDLCATLVDIGPLAPGRVDGNNPNPKLRQRSLCGLRIGEGFHLSSPNKAEDGNLYDPESGKTYHGVMTAHGNQMDLRGYIGLSIFGRTQRWERSTSVKTCSA